MTKHDPSFFLFVKMRQVTFILVYNIYYVFYECRVRTKILFFSTYIYFAIRYD